jgi:hypothetical protein
MKHEYTRVMRDERNYCWISIDSGNRRASFRFPSQKEAIDWAESHSAAIGSQLVIHDDWDLRVYGNGSTVMSFVVPTHQSIH